MKTSTIALILALMLPAAAPLRSQTATLVRDINPQEEVFVGSASSPRWLHAVGDKVFFSADEASSGRELWVTDGTMLGTVLLADACAGTCESEPRPLGHIGDTNGILFYTAFSEFGVRLWRSDGTRTGTFPLTPNGIGANRFLNELEVALSDRLLVFVGCTEATGCELWGSDGTLAGTRLVKELTPGRYDTDLGLRAVGGKVFVARHASTEQLWTTDGTEAGTVLVKDLGVGELADMTGANGHLFFTFTNESDGTELWASDGTAAGTLQITRFTAPAPFVGPPFEPVLKASGQRIYFVADDSLDGQELWRSDGTVPGTQRLTNFDVGAPFNAESGIAFVEEIGDRAVFIATDGITVPKLWTSQGSPQSVSALPVPCGGACEFLSSDARFSEPEAGSTSSPVTASTVRSCGRRTARPPVRGCCATSALARATGLTTSPIFSRLRERSSSKLWIRATEPSSGAATERPRARDASPIFGLLARTSASIPTRKEPRRAGAGSSSRPWTPMTTSCG